VPPHIGSKHALIFVNIITIIRLRPSEKVVAEAAETTNRSMEEGEMCWRLVYFEGKFTV
jgi:hypothetical protein